MPWSELTDNCLRRWQTGQSLPTKNMSIDKLIHRKASDYVAALQNPDAPELEPKKNQSPPESKTAKESGPVALKPHTVGRGAGRPPTDGESATHHIHLRVTKQRKNCYVGAAHPKSLAEWMTEILDKASHYESLDK